MIFLRSRPFFGFSLALLSAGALFGACFNPTPQEGLRCSAAGACPSGQSCTDGTCYRFGNAPIADAAIDALVYECTSQTLAGGQVGAAALDAQDADSVFWTGGSSVVLRSPKIVGTLEVFHDSALGKTPFDIVTDATNVYWTENDAVGRVMAKTKASAAVDPATELAIDQGEPSHLVLDSTHVYWSSAGDGTIRRVPKVGGAIETVASAQGAPTVLAMDETSIYWVNSGAGQIMKINKDQTGLQQMAGAQGIPSDIAISSDRVYWSVTADNEIRSVGIAGGAVSTLLTGQAGVSDLTVAGGHLYWSNKDSGDIMRAELGSMVPQLVVEEQSEALSLTFAESLYWLNATDSTNRLVRASCSSI